MDVPVIQITEPEVIHEDNNITIYDYDNSHLIYKTKDLGSMVDIENMIENIEELHNLAMFQAKMIDKLVNNDELSKSDKKYFSNFKRS